MLHTNPPSNMLERYCSQSDRPIADRWQAWDCPAFGWYMATSSKSSDSSVFGFHGLHCQNGIDEPMPPGAKANVGNPARVVS